MMKQRWHKQSFSLIMIAFLRWQNFIIQKERFNSGWTCWNPDPDWDFWSGPQTMEKTMNLSKLPSTGSPTFMLEIKLIFYLLSTPCPSTDLPKDRSQFQTIVCKSWPWKFCSKTRILGGRILKGVYLAVWAWKDTQALFSPTGKTAQ